MHEMQPDYDPDVVWLSVDEPAWKAKRGPGTYSYLAIGGALVLGGLAYSLWFGPWHARSSSGR